MDKTQKFLWFLLVALALTMLVMLPTMPAIQQTPEKNSGMFLYVAGQMLDGKTLYREVWDHKPPLVFLIDAAGLAIGQGSLWGVWGLEFIFTLSAVFILLAVLSRFFGLFPAFFGVICAAFSLMVVHHGGNYAENYAILFQAAALWLILRGGGSARKIVPWLWGGVLGGLAFMLKQNLIGLWIAAGGYLILGAIFGKRPGRWWKPAGLVSGFGISLLAMFGYFYLTGNFSAFWDAAFAYSVQYTQLGLVERVNAALDVIEMLSAIPPLFLAMAAWLVSVLLVFWNSAKPIAGLVRWPRLPVVLVVLGGMGIAGAVGIDRIPGGEQGSFGLLQWLALLAGVIFVAAGAAGARLRWPGRFSRWLEGLEPPLRADLFPMLCIAALWFPLEVLFASLSGRTYVYYLIPLIPITALLLGILAHLMLDQAGRQAGRMRVVALSLLAVVIAAPLVSFFNSLKPGADAQIQASVQAVSEHSKPGDYVLTWGSEPLINFLAKRPQPTRYIHSWFFYSGYADLAGRQGELLQDIQDRKPALILDTRDPDAPFVEDLTGCVYPNGMPPGILQQVFDYVCGHCTLIERVGPEGWPLYRYEG